MRRTHRSMHRAIWPVLAVLIGLGLTMALVMRAPPPAPAKVEGKP